MKLSEISNLSFVCFAFIKSFSSELKSLHNCSVKMNLQESFIVLDDQPSISGLDHGSSKQKFYPPFQYCYSF